ncbi:MAG: TlpA disulfide reductase family protein [Pyrinomonadaceae bacterium]
MKAFLALAILLVGLTGAFAQNEQAPILEKEIKYKDWTYQSVTGDEKINLREYTAGKKLVLVVYFAPWCHNWRHEAPFVETLYEKYKASGLGVIGVGEYDTVEVMKTELEARKITFPVVYESESRDAKKDTLHYEYRQETGDTRNWGSPWNIFLLPAEMKKKGDTLTKKTYVVNGELIEPEAEKFVREKLGLPPEESKMETAAKKEIEACPEEKPVEFQKPEN